MRGVCNTTAWGPSSWRETRVLSSRGAIHGCLQAPPQRPWWWGKEAPSIEPTNHIAAFSACATAAAGLICGALDAPQAAVSRHKQDKNQSRALFAISSETVCVVAAKA